MSERLELAIMRLHSFALGMQRKGDNYAIGLVESSADRIYAGDIFSVLAHIGNLTACVAELEAGLPAPHQAPEPEALMTIVDFLSARLDEDEAAARACTPGPWRVNPMSLNLNSNVVCAQGELDWVGTAGQRLDVPVFTGQTANRSRAQWEADAAHIARHDPARVLREVEAKRAIVAQHEGVHECPSPRPWSLDGNTDHVAEEECWTLRNLASVRADHPDYNPKWRVA